MGFSALEREALEGRQIKLGRAANRSSFPSDSDLARCVKVDFVLKDFLDDDFHLVVGLEIHQRPGAGVDGGEPLLDQGRELKSPADLVHDLFFLQSVNHFLSWDGVKGAQCSAEAGLADPKPWLCSNSQISSTASWTVTFIT